VGELHVDDLEDPLLNVRIATRILTTFNNDYDLWLRGDEMAPDRTIEMVSYTIDQLAVDVETLRAAIYGEAAEQPAATAGEATP
jgi:hypothetical protein